MKEIIYGFLEKGKDGLCRDIRYIKEERLPSLIKELEKYINYSRCCETLKEEYIPDFSNWLKNNKYIHYCDNYYISEDNNVWNVNSLAEKYVKETSL